ncbi:MAG: hypothetical protein PHF86_12465 [Candidatus Nanoarchaeia archaeon]|nr:hypothetical protein [Candidatus Nanoarchaeia archaeon]
MTELKCWKKVGIKLGGTKKTYSVFNNQGGGKMVFITHSDLDKNKPIRVNGINKRGYIKDEYFKDESEAIIFANKYMKQHDKC